MKSKNYTFDLNDFNNACIYGHLRLAEYIYETHSNPSELVKSSKRGCFFCSCKSGNLDLIKYTYKLSLKFNNEIDLLGDITMYAFDLKNLDLLKWFIETALEDEYEKDNFRGSINYFFSCVCGTGSLEIVQWFWNFAKDSGFEINIHKDNDDAFYTTCMTGNLDIIKWLLTLDIINYDLNQAVTASCESGNIKLVQWFFMQGEVDLHRGNELIFVSACGSGNLELCEWLWDLSIKYGRKINIHVIDDYDNKFKEGAINAACIGGNVDLVKWIFKLSLESDVGEIDLHKINFGHCIESKNIEMCKFIWDLTKEHDITIKIKSKMLETIILYEYQHLDVLEYVLKLSLESGDEKIKFGSIDNFSEDVRYIIEKYLSS